MEALRRIIALCTPRHRVTHLGRVITVDGDAAAQVAFEHLRAVTGMTDDQAGAHIDAAFTRWEWRSRITWALDLRILTDAGITLAPPPATRHPPPAPGPRPPRRHCTTSSDPAASAGPAVPG